MSRCWAHNLDKVRCALDAGHDEPHTVYITWRDDECYEPDKTVHTLMQPVATAGDNGAGSIKPPPPAPRMNDTCVACQHKHRGRECPRACECKEFIG